MTVSPSSFHNLRDDYKCFFENSPCGFVTAEGRGTIIKCNRRFAGWLGYEPTELVGTIFSDLLTITGKIFYETHLAPLLRMQGFFEEAALELVSKSGGRVQFLLNAAAERDETGSPLFARLALFKATDRRLLEQNLQSAKNTAEDSLKAERETSTLREQFIAVLGHDLRNPLGAIGSCADLLLRTEISDRQRSIIEMLRTSSTRMGELIENVMDFARSRLGDGLGITMRQTYLEPVLHHTVDELKVAWPDREIHTEINLASAIPCDPDRIAQLLSNLVANAVTHGSSETPVTVKAGIHGKTFELTVENGGKAIPPELQKVLFQPFTREKARPSQNGLGLGLYIASEIAKAHGGTLEVQSSEVRTRFEFRMTLAAV